jgi:hypothetical protein
VFGDSWKLAVASKDGPASDKWKFANVRVIDFDESHRDSFIEFGAEVRGVINSSYPDEGASMGEFDVVCHSMGGLDSFVALTNDLDAADAVPADKRLARAFNFVTMDTPYRGIPNVDARKKMSAPDKVNQCEAMRPGSPQLTLVDASAAGLASRATRITCYGVDSATQIEVQSGNLYADTTRFGSQRQTADYRFFQVPGASHSGSQGITQSPITIANLFFTLTTTNRLS